MIGTTPPRATPPHRSRFAINNSSPESAEKTDFLQPRLHGNYPPMQPSPFFRSRPAPLRADGLLWRDILRHVPFFSMRVANSSMTIHTLRLRNRDGRAPLFRGVNTPRAKNERSYWKCYAEE